MDHIQPRRIALRPDGHPMTADEISELHDQIAAGFDKIDWSDDTTREIVEAYMAGLVDRLPERRTKTFDQASARGRR